MFANRHILGVFLNEAIDIALHILLCRSFQFLGASKAGNTITKISGVSSGWVLHEHTFYDL